MHPFQTFTLLIPYLFVPLSLSNPISSSDPPSLNLIAPHNATLLATSYPVPSTPLTLDFQYPGDSIPFPDLLGSLTTALRQISPNVQQRPHEAIPADGWNSRGRASGVGFRVVSGIWMGPGDGVVSWQILSWTLQGLVRWGSEEDRQGRRNNAREWDFLIRVTSGAASVERVGSGSIRQLP